MWLLSNWAIVKYHQLDWLAWLMNQSYEPVICHIQFLVRALDIKNHSAGLTRSLLITWSHQNKVLEARGARCVEWNLATLVKRPWWQLLSHFFKTRFRPRTTNLRGPIPPSTCGGWFKAIVLLIEIGTRGNQPKTLRGAYFKILSQHH
jgi:hypothetical protein